MRPELLLIAIPILLAQPAAAGVRAPSCDAIAAFAYGPPVDPIELTFGKPPAVMTVDEFDQAIDIVGVCLDAAQAQQTENMHPWFRERRRNRIAAYSSLAEDLKIYRSRARERELRAPQTTGAF